MSSLPPPAVARAALALLVSALALLGPGCARQTNEAFPVSAYLDSPDNLQGNRYTLEAEIDAQLQWREGTGRLLSVRPLGTEPAATRLPVFIADSLEANLMVAQRYRFELTVRHGGLLYVTALRKL
jgi:hypothetical protein